MVGLKEEVRIGMVGYKFMGKAHSHAYQGLSTFFQLEVKPVWPLMKMDYKGSGKSIAQRNHTLLREPIGLLGILLDTSIPLSI